MKALQKEEDLNEIFGDVESNYSFSSDSEDEKVDLKKFDASMPLSFNHKDEYIEKMIELMKLENRDPSGKKLFKV